VEPGRFGDGGREAGAQSRRLDRDEKRLRPTGEGREATKPVGGLGEGRAHVRSRRKIDDEDVDGAAREEHPRDRQALVERLRRQDDEPVEPNPAGNGLDRVERPGEIQPGDDRAARLGFGDHPQGEGRRAG
jgi:hypothetical protein